MIKINKLFYYVITSLIGIVIFTSIGLIFSLPWGINILCMVSFVVLSSLDVEKVEITKQATYKNSLTGEFYDDFLEPGYYWTVFLTRSIVTNNIDTTPNKYVAVVSTETLNNITVTITGTLWARIVNASKIQKQGINDYKTRIEEDWQDTLRVFVSKKTDIELRAIQNKILGIGSDTNDFDENDTLFTGTLPELGFLPEGGSGYYDINKYLKINIGTIVIPKEVIDANEQLEISKRKAEAEDFENKERTKRVDLIEIETRLSISGHTKPFHEFEENAKRKLELGNKGALSHEDQQKIVSEMLVAVRRATNAKIDPKIKSRIRQDSENKLNVREGRRTDYGGLSGTNTLVNPQQKKTK